MAQTYGTATRTGNTHTPSLETPNKEEIGWEFEGKEGKGKSGRKVRERWSGSQGWKLDGEIELRETACLCTGGMVCALYRAKMRTSEEVPLVRNSTAGDKVK